MEIIKTGFYVGNLYDILNEEQLLDLKNNIQYVKDFATDKNNITYRFDYFGGPEYVHRNIKLDEIAERAEFIEKNNYTAFQKWWEYLLDNKTISNFFDNISIAIGKKIYPEFDVTRDTLNSTGNYTLYEKGDFIRVHEDGFDEDRLCVVLLYLSDDWKEGDGGELVIKNNGEETIVEPKLGTFAVLDFMNNNVTHEVLKVNGDFKRFTYIHFLNFKEENTDTYKKFKELKQNFR
jgi:Rps23 Pro-64 3,4-dihydroxylase Tpa1-like proline 4-hydroxylase